MRRAVPALVVLLAVALSACTSSATRPTVSSSTSAPLTAVSRSTPSGAAPTRLVTTPRPTPSRSAPRSTGGATRANRANTPARHASTRAAAPLPLPDSTGDASQVITVTTPAAWNTTATLQAWQRAAGGWSRVGPAVPADLGSDGMSTHPSEQLSATPEGSFTLTQAFGRDPNPGTRLPYLQTTPADWWISQAGPLYNTHQRCSSGCAFTQGNPNEHLFDETPFYDYAVVIDYNTRNSPTGVRPGAGSAFFLHVSVGEPTAGCVSIPVDQLVRIMRWLRPARHPRILIGVA